MLFSVKTSIKSLHPFAIIKMFILAQSLASKQNLSQYCSLPFSFGSYPFGKMLETHKSLFGLLQINPWLYLQFSHFLFVNVSTIFSILPFIVIPAHYLSRLGVLLRFTSYNFLYSSTQLIATLIFEGIGNHPQCSSCRISSFGRIFLFDSQPRQTVISKKSFGNETPQRKCRFYPTCVV